MQIRGWIVDIEGRRTFAGAITIEERHIVAVEELGEKEIPEIPNQYIIPGFVDSHVHIESSMLIPSEFARLAVVHGTVATISDPHEIANVCGLEGVEFMIKNGKTVPFNFYFGAPSCVPATNFETAGATLDSAQVHELLARPEIVYLSEMMNFPGVIQADPEVMKKIESAKLLKKPVDGHAPGLRGKDLETYVNAGISTDHECFTLEEAEEKIRLGMKILIREGSAARNFEALAPLINLYPDRIMFCSDDKHPDSLVEGHINQLCSRAVKKGMDPYNVLKAACINPVLHYKLPNGLLRKGDIADLVIVNNLVDFKVISTYIGGIRVAGEGNSLVKSSSITPVNNFNCEPIDAGELEVAHQSEKQMPVIEAFDGQLITGKVFHEPLVRNGFIVPDPENDIIKLAVVNRYHPAKPALAFIRNTGLKSGAIASSVAHDSHNIIAMGCDDESLARAINLVVESKGGISWVDGHSDMLLPLPVAGLMSAEDGYTVASQYTRMDHLAKLSGSTLQAPYMTLSFMALLVIPHLKLSDKGLFDGDSFSFYR